LSNELSPLCNVTIKATSNSGKVTAFKALVLLNTPVEVNYYRNGGILNTVLRNLVK
jgi:aconitate hydratase